MTARVKRPKKNAAELRRIAVRQTWNHGLSGLHDGIQLLDLLVHECKESNQALFAIKHVFERAQSCFDQLDDVVGMSTASVRS